MSSSKKGVIVSRSYRAVPDDCVRALVLLLEKSVVKEGSAPTTLENAKVRSEKDSRVMDSIP